MNEIEVFRNRLLRIGINTTFSANYPWIYLDTVNGKKVKGKFYGNHGFTAFFARANLQYRITDIGVIFAKIRKTLRKIEEDKQVLRKFANQVKERVNTHRYFTDLDKGEINHNIDDVLNNFYK